MKETKETPPSEYIIYKCPSVILETLYASRIYSGDDSILFKPQQIFLKQTFLTKKVKGAYILVTANHFQLKKKAEGLRCRLA